MVPADAFCPNCGARAEAIAPAAPAAAATPKAKAPKVAAPRVGGAEYKGVVPRFLASLVDFVLYLIFTVVMASQFGSTSTEASSGISFSFNLQGWPAAVVYLVSLAYVVLLEGYLGGTVGKLVLGIRVVDAGGGAPGPARALIRNVLRIVDFLPLFYLLGILLVAFTKQKRRMGDMVAGTYVVSSRSVGEMKASGVVAKPANTVVAGAAGVLALAMIVSGLVFSPQVPGAPSGGTSGQSVAKPQAAPTPVPTKAPSSGGGPFGVSLPSISLPGLGGDPADVAGKWTGSMSITAAKIDGATAEEQRSMDQQMNAVKSMAIPFQITFDGKSKDSGSAAIGGGMAAGSDKLPYKVSGDKVTMEGKVDDGKLYFEGKVSKKGNSYEVEGTFKGEGPATGINKSKIMKIEGSWKATKQ